MIYYTFVIALIQTGWKNERDSYPIVVSFLIRSDILNVYYTA